MKGLIIKYSPKDPISRTRINHFLFGRILTRNYRGKKYSYYIPGSLHGIKFSRLMDSKIFVEFSEASVNMVKNLPTDLGVIEYIEDEREDEKVNMLTGEEYWKRLAEEQNLMLRYRKKSKA